MILFYKKQSTKINYITNFTYKYISNKNELSISIKNLSSISVSIHIYSPPNHNY